MLDLIKEAVVLLQSETASYATPVQVWMRVMGISFLASIIFMIPKSHARWVFAALVLNLLGLVVGKILFPEASRTEIGSIVHLLFWPAILWMIWKPSTRPARLSEQQGAFSKIYLVWLGWASLLLAISLLFDLRSFAAYFL